MATFRCQADPTSISQWLTEACARRGWHLTVDSPGIRSFEIEEGSLGLKVTFEAAALEDTSATTLDINVSVPVRVGLKVELSFLSNLIFVFLFFVLIRLEAVHFLVPVAVAILGFLLLQYYLGRRRTTDRLATTTVSSLMRDLRAETRIAQLTPIGHQLFTGAAGTTLTILRLLAYMAILAIATLSLGAFLAVVLALPIALLVLGEATAAQREHTWRRPIVYFQTAWTSWCMSSIVLTFLLILLPGLASTVRDSEVTRQSFFATLNEYALFVVRNAPELYEQPVSTDPLLVLFVVVYAVVVTGCLHTSVSFWKSIVEHCKQASLERLDQAEDLKLMSGDPESGAQLDGIIAWSHVVLAGLFHWVAVIIAVDLVSFMLFSKCVVVASLKVPLSIFLLWADAAPFVGRIVVFGCLTIIALPGIACIGVALFRLGVLVKNEFRFAKRGTERMDDGYISLLVTKLSRELGIRRASVEIVTDSRCHISTITSVLGFGHKIVISRQLHDSLSNRELEALILHEMHHVRSGARRVAILKLFSVLLLFPIHFLLVFYDFAGEEHKADAFSVSVLGDSKPLLTALAKLSVIGIFKVSREPRATEAEEEQSKDRTPGTFQELLSNVVDGRMIKRRPCA